MLRLAIVFLGDCPDCCLSWIWRSGSPFVGRGEDTFVILLVPRLSFLGAWVPRGALQTLKGSWQDQASLKEGSRQGRDRGREGR